MSNVISTLSGLVVPRKRGLVTRFVVAQPIAAIGLAVLILFCIAAIGADVLAPYDPTSLSYTDIFAPPSAAHWMGTDEFGRDIFSRILYGARTALTIGLVSSIVGCTVGALIGIASAYFGGIVDLVIQRIMDILLAFPIIILALVIVAALGQYKIGEVDVSLLIAIAIPAVPNVARVLRSSALSVRTMQYVDAAQALGFSTTRIILRHIAPNVIAPYLVLLTAYMGQAILLEASLSYLGLGVGEPTPAWGLMLSGTAADAFRDAPWQVLFPGLAISITVFGFNLFGDGLRDWLDPKFGD
ncbi:ABC transporter permease [Celeribacter indicus]|uniref:Glutathione transport system permease GsiD n=1 Tax=Celeribacter indicus TaxID=1208324 RepID=A0A0B5DWP6_9RHOB|nr:ABC transporter permease [Celeribacter indicus]AJE47853.1 glutathione transport system permease GsiD [Celeribacter indicus]SDW24987.1 peptide/nickel transport system permease protein [Celeribacter indicus]